MSAIEVLQQAKNLWDLLHTAGGSAVKNEAGEKYIFVQGATGGAIIDVAGGDSWDEILVGITGDVVQAIVMVPFGVAGVVVEASWIVAKGTGSSSSASLGDLLKDYYKDIKSDIATEYWKYEKDFNFMAPGGVMLHYDYAKVLYDRNGAKFDAGYQVVQETYQSQYEDYIANKQSIISHVNTAILNTKIENSNGVFKVTLPDGTVYAEGDGTNNTLVGGDKNDTLTGGAGADYLSGGAGYDTYITGNNDIITDSDDKGRVFFNNSLLQ
ncbi:MAG: hypothetical protein QM497_06120, partial [Sulfurimonas sp.]